MPADTACHSSLQSSSLPASHSPLYKTLQPVAAFACPITSRALATSGSPSGAEACMLKSASPSHPNAQAPSHLKSRSENESKRPYQQRLQIRHPLHDPLPQPRKQGFRLLYRFSLSHQKREWEVSIGHRTLNGILPPNPDLRSDQVGDRRTSCFNKNS